MSLCLSAAACQTPAQHEAEADREVYALVAARRAELEADPDAFDLRSDPESLRARLLAGEAPPEAPIGLTECLHIAAENSRDYQDRKESLYLTALDLTLERYRLGWIPYGALSTNMLGTGTTSLEQTATADLGFSRLLGDGGQIVAGIGIDLLRVLSGDADWSVDGVLSLSFTQPLLGGAGQRIVLEPLTQAERDLVYEVRSYERFRRTFAVDVAARYYQVLQQVDAAENARVNYENLKQLAERNRALADAGRLDDLQKGQVVQDELRSEDRLMSTRASLASTLDEFKLFLGLPVEVELQFDSAELARMGAADPQQLELDERVVIAVGMSSRLDYQTILDQLEDAERRVEIAADALRAGLDLVASSGTVSTPGRPGEFDLRDSSWSLGLALDLPMDRLPERNAYRSTLIARDASRRAAEAFGDAIRVSLRESLRNAETSLRSFAIQRVSVPLAERRAESAKLLQDAGRADTRDILEAEEDLLEAKNSLTGALVDYELARLALWRDTEHLGVSEEGFSFQAIAPMSARSNDIPDTISGS
jgi:outer membrane protein TolC